MADTHINIPMARLIELETAEHERDILRRWKSTHAPRLQALEGLLRTAQQEAHAGREAVATLASERAANALLTNEVERLRTELAAERERWTRALGNVMPADFKDWHENTAAELPDIAAWAIRNLRDREAFLEGMLADVEDRA